VVHCARRILEGYKVEEFSIRSLLWLKKPDLEGPGRTKTATAQRVCWNGPVQDCDGLLLTDGSIYKPRGGAESEFDACDYSEWVERPAIPVA
jgi:hypothetical protein